MFSARAVSTLAFCASFAASSLKVQYGNVRNSYLATEQPWPQYISLQNLG